MSNTGVEKKICTCGMPISASSTMDYTIPRNQHGQPLIKQFKNVMHPVANEPSCKCVMPDAILCLAARHSIELRVSKDIFDGCSCSCHFDEYGGQCSHEVWTARREAGL